MRGLIRRLEQLNRSQRAWGLIVAVALIVQMIVDPLGAIELVARCLAELMVVGLIWCLSRPFVYLWHAWRRARDRRVWAQTSF